MSSRPEPGRRTPTPSGAPLVSLERLLSVAEARGLSVRRRADGQVPEAWICCPVHQERTPSLHATWVKGGQRGGFVLLHCFGCNALGQDIVEALGLSLSDLYDEPLPQQDRVWERGRSTERRKSGQRRGHRGRLPALVPLPAFLHRRQTAGGNRRTAAPRRHASDDLEHRQHLPPSRDAGSGAPNETSAVGRLSCV